MRAYSNYDFYISQYGGEALGEFAFDRAAIKASAYIDRITFGRARNYTESPEHELQYCVCEMAEAIKQHDDATVNGREISIISNQGYSEHYVSPHNSSSAIKSLEFDLMDIAMVYLPYELLSLSLEV